jgi:Tfp pilus assembly protein PilV
MRERKRNRKGFSLAEAILATVVLGVAAAAVLLPFTTGASIRAEGAHRTLGARLASDLMEEIIRTEFDQIISKYGTYSESQGHIVKNFYTSEEFTNPMYAKFSRVATCEYVYVPQESGTGEANFIHATVRAYYNDKEVAIVNRLISK